MFYLCEMVETHEDDGWEDEDGGGDEEEDVAEVEELLVAGWPLAPGPQGHHARASHQRHPDSSLSSGHETNSVKICKDSTLILDVRKWRWLVCWCWVGHFSFPPNSDWFLSTTSPAQPCPTLPVAACCLLLCGQVVTVQCPVSGYNVHTIYTIYTIYTLHSRCATTAASLPGRRHSS